MQDESIDAIAQAASELSRLKTGALIVFERNDQLGDVVRSGIEIDAKVTSYLLRNIFFDKSPLHDGAVVIRDRRICAAGCLLQLSRRSDLDPSLGTRHRAAIGMSENSDAIVIVVSEETGIISVAYRRQITRNFTYSTLKAFLYKVMLNQSDDALEIEEKEAEENE
jgi:diadenylate cyclase